MQRTNSLEKTWCWERLKAGGEGDDRGWDGWMASLTWWTWVCADSRSWWWTGKPGMLQSMASQRVGHNWATELNWRDKHGMNPLGRGPQDGYSQRQSVEQWEPGAAGRQHEELASDGRRVSAQMIKQTSWRRTVVAVTQQCGHTECHWAVHLKMVKVANFTLCIF